MAKRYKNEGEKGDFSPSFFLPGGIAFGGKKDGFSIQNEVVSEGKRTVFFQKIMPISAFFQKNSRPPRGGKNTKNAAPLRHDFKILWCSDFL